MKPPAAPGINTRPVRMGTTHITTYPNKSLHLKSRMILNSNLYEPAEPNPMTPNPPNKHPPNEHLGNERPGNERPPHERLPHKRPPHECPPNENSPYEHHPPAKTRQSAKQAWAKRPPPNQTFQTTHLPKQVCGNIRSFPSAKTHRRGHHVPYTRFGGSGPGQNTGPHSHPYPPILDFPQHIRGRNKYGATHPLQQVSPERTILAAQLDDLNVKLLVLAQGGVKVTVFFRAETNIDET
ncbi:hypothetical protein BS47DRAFT_1365128 [Hydnum rufescens UP504]|uniref:Uncharacterized protein n=1 Tax=Hydnum rufescens UP504 TaxID=1448309 RepID=A0A9P6APQ7_9AGAM|nr:hypothetical protein BS47DRAFT_1365128 [Hydnum rufescens UP504]